MSPRQLLKMGAALQTRDRVFGNALFPIDSAGERDGGRPGLFPILELLQRGVGGIQQLRQTVSGVACPAVIWASAKSFAIVSRDSLIGFPSERKFRIFVREGLGASATEVMTGVVLYSVCPPTKAALIVRPAPNAYG